MVIPLTTSSWTMLQRNLLSTGVTGAGSRHTALTYRVDPDPFRAPRTAAGTG